jgi:hypothetical protein
MNLSATTTSEQPGTPRVATVHSIRWRISGMTGVGDGSVSMLMMLLAGMVIDSFSYLPVFIAVGLLPVLSLKALMALVGTIRAISLKEIMDRKETA